MKTFVALFFLFCLFHTPQARAQCANGIPEAGNPDCLPPDDPNSPYYQGDRNQPRNQPQQPRAIWSDRWGAIVTAPDGDAGTAENQHSKDEAIQMATSICSRNGAQHCEVLIAYYNQCAAAALGGGHLKGSSAPSKDQAEQQALDHCGGSNVCKIVYSACSLPVRIQ
jgi:hypothetical protein